MRITCARCNRPVDRVEVSDDIDRGTVRIRAFCHGAHDIMTLTNDELQDPAMMPAIKGETMGYAFRTPSEWAVHLRTLQMHDIIAAAMTQAEARVYA